MRQLDKQMTSSVTVLAWTREIGSTLASFRPKNNEKYKIGLHAFLGQGFYNITDLVCIFSSLNSLGAFLRIAVYSRAEMVDVRNQIWDWGQGSKNLSDRQEIKSKAKIIEPATKETDTAPCYFYGL